MVKRLIVLIGALGIISLLLLPASQAVGQSTREPWSSPQFIDDGWWESLTTDVQGTTHLTWYGGLSENGIAADVMKYAYLPADGEWSKPNDVIYTGSGGYTIRNAIAITTDGMLHAIFRANVKHETSNAPIAGAINAANWSTPQEIDTIGYYVSMTADSNDVLHIAYNSRLDNLIPLGGGNPEAGICTYCEDLYYRRSTDGGKTWSDPVGISTLPDTGSDRMDIFQGQSGRLYIDWDEGHDWYVGKGNPKDVRIVYSDDEGLTWSKPIILDGGNDPNKRPIQIAVTEMRDKEMMAVWRYSNDLDRGIYYQISQDNGVTWTDPKAIDGIVARSVVNETGLDDYDLITDKLGVVHLFAVGQPDLLSKANPTLYHVAFQQGLWTQPFPIAYSQDYWPEWPKASIGIHNDIHLVWFSRGIKENAPIKSYTDILKVYYSHLPGGFSVEATPTFRPTATILPTPTVFQHFDPTVTPLPTLDNYKPIYSTATKDNNAALTVVGGVFAAGLFCLVVVVLIRFFGHSR